MRISYFLFRNFVKELLYHNLRNGQVLERKDNRANNFAESISTLGAKILALFSKNLRQ